MHGANTTDAGAKVAAASRLTIEQLRELARRNTAARRERTAASIPRVPRDGGDLPVSFAQERMWFLHEFAPGSPAYNISSVGLFRSSAEVRAFVAGLNVVVDRHEALRSIFPAADGRPVQRVLPALVVRFPQFDLTALPTQVQAPAARRLVKQEALRPFDLARGPLLRGAIVTLSPRQHVVIFAVHHIVFDGTSMSVMLREIGTLAKGPNAADDLPALQVQYADYAAYQRQVLQGETLDRLVAYWRRQLDGVQPIDLPTDYPRPDVPVSRSVSRSLTLTPAESARVESLTQSERATPFMTLLACFAVLLHRLSGRTDLTIGAPVANRLYPEVHDLIGCFVNNLVLRIDLSGDITFRELLQRVRATCTDAYAHQALPYEKLVEALRPRRRPQENPLFQVLFEYNYTPIHYSDVDALGSASGAGTLIRPGTALFELNLCIDRHNVDGRACWICTLEGDGDLYSADTIETLLQRYRSIVGTLVDTPDVPLWQITLAGDEPIPHWKEWRSADSADLQTVFEVSVDRSPDAIAVQSGDDQITYRELDRRANRLAHYLLVHGAGPERRVAICLDRSIDCIVAMAAALKASSAYVPLDRGYPANRLSHIVRTSGAALVVTDAQLADAFADSAARVICVDREASAIAATPAARPWHRARAANLAYVMYTSGSTGEPKGVEISRGSVGNYALGAVERYAIQRSDRVLQFGSLSFDLSAEEIWMTLAGGAALVLRNEAMLDGAELVRVCGTLGVTVLDFPTVFWHGLAAQVRRGDVRPPACVRLCIAAGERMNPRSASDWTRHCSVPLMNGYGPTEVTIATTMYDVPVEIATRVPSEVPIGTPFARSRAVVLDERLQPIATGLLGELFLGGPGVARGYSGDPALTADRFVPDPIAALPGERLYRTGDVVRQLRSGELLFCRRADRQVKIRGFRIELQEIEAVLARHPGVQAAAVGVVERQNAEPELAAWIVASRDVTPTAVRQFLAHQLPQYMVPRSVVCLERMPLTVTGKTDYAALPAPAPVEASAPAAPRNDLERLIAEAWREELGLDAVGIHDNFFDAGGHSLLAVRLRARLASALHRTIDLVDFFRYPTIAAFAGHLGDAPASAPDRAQSEARAARRHAVATRQRSLREGPRV